MKFGEAKELALSGTIFISNGNKSIWWIHDNDKDSSFKYSASPLDGNNLPKYRTRFTECGMATNGGYLINYEVYIPEFDLSIIPLNEF